jgi:hypothetical protein
MPSFPTTAISADAPSSITYSSDGSGGKVHITHLRARLVEHIAECHHYQFGVSSEAFVVGGR